MATTDSNANWEKLAEEPREKRVASQLVLNEPELECSLGQRQGVLTADPLNQAGRSDAQGRVSGRSDNSSVPALLSANHFTSPPASAPSGRHCGLGLHHKVMRPSRHPPPSQPCCDPVLSGTCPGVSTPGSVLEMQTLRPRPRPTEVRIHTAQDAPVIPTHIPI